MTTHQTPDDLIAKFGYQFPMEAAAKVVFHQPTMAIFADLCEAVHSALGDDKRGFFWTDTRNNRFKFHVNPGARSFDLAALCYQAMLQAAECYENVTLSGISVTKTEHATYTNEPLSRKWWAPESTKQVLNPEQLIAALPYQFADLSNLTFIRGWHATFVILCISIDTALGAERGPRAFHWTQLKSKFGQARWYWSMQSNAKAPIRISQQRPDGSFKMLTYHQSTDPVWQTVSDLVDAAQARANDCCEVCGAPAVIGSHGGRYSTLCEQHAMMERKNQPLPPHFWSPTSYSSDAKWWTA